MIYRMWIRKLSDDKVIFSGCAETVKQCNLVLRALYKAYPTEDFVLEYELLTEDGLEEMLFDWDLRFKEQSAIMG